MAEAQATIATEGGILSGILCRGGAVGAFKGIPYAAPPVGNLRWRAPGPVPHWTGTRAADRFAARCMQPDRPPSAIGYFGPEPQSEDCLYLNVWSGARSGDERRAVMVWFHGGAYAVGSGSLPIFDGEKLALKGIVVVTANYRLGRLGFLSHPDLAKETPTGASGNYGLLDQIAALHWVRRNIAAFGGDPGRVTIFGQSAGSSSVNTMMASPLARGLFHRAIGQSGGALGWHAFPLRAEAERAGVAFAQALGLRTMTELRARPAREIQFIRPDQGGRLNEIYDSNDAAAIDRATAWATLDGYVIKDRVRDIFESGEQYDVPLLTGATRDEGATLPGIRSRGEFETRARAELGAAAPDFLALYRAADDAGAAQASRTATGHRLFNWENWLWARLQARTGRAPVFAYHFARVPPRVPNGGEGDRSRDLGAFHTADIPYAFDHLEARDWPWQETDRRLADRISSYWANFAERGDPNGSGLPSWPRFDESTQQVMRFGDETAVAPVPDADKLAFWSAVDDALAERLMAKIARLEIVSLDYVLPGGRAYGTARGLNYRRSCSLIMLETDEGVVGIGDAAGPTGAIREYLALLAPFFVGRRLYDFEIIAAQVRHKLYHFGVQNHLTSCLGGINIAVYDAIGKTLGLPVCDLLGGRSADRLPCYATTGYFADDPAAEIEAQLSKLPRGRFAGVKIKIGASPASDLERVRIARRILGDDILLMVDVNGNYTVDIALDSLRRIAPFDIHWCEEPLPPTDIRGYAELRARSPIRLSAGEAHYTALDFKALVDARAVDILQPSIISGGGFGEAKAVAALAQMNNLRLSPPCWGSAVAIAAAVHFAASLPVWPHSDRVPYPMLVEYDVSENPLRDELAINPVRLGDEGLEVPTGPGLGIDLDRAAIERLRSR